MKSIILLISLNKLFISYVAMDRFYKSNTETDLTTLHYVTFIESLVVSPMEDLSFESEWFTNNSINKVIEAKTNEHFVLLEENLFVAPLLYKKIMESYSKTCRMKF
jgi:hypothetical protein